MRSAKKPHRTQAWRLKSKNIIIYTPGLKILNACDNYTSVAPSWIQISNASKYIRKTSLSPRLAFSSFWCPQVSAFNFLKLLEKKPSLTLWHPCSPGQPWPGREGGHTATMASQERKRSLSWRVSAGKLSITMMFDSRMSYRSDALTLTTLSEKKKKWRK